MIPPVMAKLRRMDRGFPALFCLLSVAFLMGFFRTSAWGAALLVFFAGCMCIWAAEYAKARRIRRDVVEAQGSVCPACAHGLKGLETNGPCPECGTVQNLDATRRLWLDYLKLDSWPAYGERPNY